MAYAIADHPIIANMERTGYPDGKNPTYPHCPFCGAECDNVYLSKNNEVIGCSDCVSMYDAWECGECFPD